jgi:outer membrane protein TolC
LPAAGSGVQPESLEQAWALALATNQQLQAMRLSVSASQSNLLAVRAERWPAASLDASYRVRDREPASRIEVTPGFSFTTPLSQSENFAFAGRVSLPLYTGGEVSHRIEAAEWNVTVSEQEQLEFILDLKMRVAEDYVAVLQAIDDLAVAQSHVRSLESHARDIQTRCQHDQARQNDLLEAKVAVANGRHEAIRARHQLESSKAAYNRRVGRPLDHPVALVSLKLPPEKDDLDALSAIALECRPEIARIEAQTRALQNEAASVLAGRYPHVYLFGDYLFEENRFRSPEGITSAAVGVSWNAFDASKTKLQAESLFAQAQALARSRDDLCSAIRLQVRQAWLAVQEHRNRLTATQEAIGQADENLRVTRRLYQAGLETQTAVLQAEYLRVQTNRNHNSAMHDAALALVYLLRVTGQI